MSNFVHASTAPYPVKDLETPRISIWPTASSSSARSTAPICPVLPDLRAGMDVGFGDVLESLSVSGDFPTKVVVVADGGFCGGLWRFDPRYGLAAFDRREEFAATGIDVVTITPSQAIAFAIANGLGAGCYDTVLARTDEVAGVAVLNFRGDDATKNTFTHRMGRLYNLHPRPFAGNVTASLVGTTMLQYLVVETGLQVLKVSTLLSRRGIDLLTGPRCPINPLDALSLLPKLLSYVIAESIPGFRGTVVIDGLGKASVEQAVAYPREGDLGKAWADRTSSLSSVLTVTNHSQLAAAGAAAYAATI